MLTKMCEVSLFLLEEAPCLQRFRVVWSLSVFNFISEISPLPKPARSHGYPARGGMGSELREACNSTPSSKKPQEIVFQGLE